MTANLVTLGTGPFEVEMSHVREPITGPTVVKFLRNRGPEMISQLLFKAGYNYGRWSAIITNTFPSTGRTPHIVIRKAEDYGVVMRVKPRSNDSGCVIRLVVERDRKDRFGKPMTAQSVFEQLIKVNPHHTPPSHLNNIPAPSSQAGVEPLPADQANLEMLLLAVMTAEQEQAEDTTPNDFLVAMLQAIGPNEVMAEWAQVLTAAIGQGLVEETPTGYHVTGRGQNLLPVDHIAQLDLPATPPAPAQVEKAAPPAPAAPVAPVPPSPPPLVKLTPPVPAPAPLPVTPLVSPAPVLATVIPMQATNSEPTPSTEEQPKRRIGRPPMSSKAAKLADLAIAANKMKDLQNDKAKLNRELEEVLLKEQKILEELAPDIRVMLLQYLKGDDDS